MNVSPCLGCTRVEDPRACDNKDCRLWRNWFVQKWDALRLQTRLDMEKAETRPIGVAVGGVYYPQPHRMREYLQEDPCKGCLCPKDLCAIPCKIKRAWLQAREDAFIG